MAPKLIHLKVLLPSHVFADKTDITRLVFETPEGSIGLLPHRLDCIVALAPGILSYESEEEGLAYIAVDRGVLVKAGENVALFVRNAVKGSDLGKLRINLEETFMTIDYRQKGICSVPARMDGDLLCSFVEFRHE